MKLVAFTIVLDGMPFLPLLFPIFEKLPEFRWIVVEGASGNTADTSWCARQKPRLSRDGSHEFLSSLKDDRILHIYKKSWTNKTEMVNAALAQISEPCTLLQCDADEIWEPLQLRRIVDLFEQRPQLGSIMFGCRYFVGENLVLQGEHCFGDRDYEWKRTWRFSPGMRFSRHEPPVLDGANGYCMAKDESRKLVGEFRHYAYATEAQVKFKSRFYKYGDGIVEAWRKLQAHQHFPVELARFFHWIDDPNWPKVVRA